MGLNTCLNDLIAHFTFSTDVIEDLVKYGRSASTCAKLIVHFSLYIVLILQYTVNT